MPRKSKYTEEEKRAYFANIRKNDPKRLCSDCNRYAVEWFEDGRQACNWHKDVKAPTRVAATKQRPKEIIDMLVLLIDEAALRLNPATDSDLIKKLMAASNQVRPDGVKKE